jgi:hypothetical protein
LAKKEMASRMKIGCGKFTSGGKPSSRAVVAPSLTWLVDTASVAGLGGSVGLGAYNAAKHGVAWLTRNPVQKRRTAIVVPDANALGPMCQLDPDLAAARGALNVGLVVTVTPNRPIAVRVKKDGTVVDAAPSGQALEIEANAEVDIDVGDVATVRVRGGRRRAQQTAELLEARWSREVAPYPTSANVEDLGGLSAKITEAQQLDTAIKAKDMQVQSLQVQIDELADAAQKLRAALERSKAPCRARGRILREACRRSRRVEC